MKAGSIAGRSGQAIAPPSMEGEVGNLPIRRALRDGIYFMESAWYPSAEEIELIKSGQPIILGISSPQHPVVRMAVEPPPPEVIGISEIDASHPLAGRVLVWDEIADAPVGNCRRVDCSKGEAEIMLPAPEGDAEPSIEVRKGTYTIRTQDQALIEQYRKEAQS